MESKGTKLYAIVKTGGKQYTVKPGDARRRERREGEAGVEGSTCRSFFSQRMATRVAPPAEAAGSGVTADQSTSTRGKKQLVFKFKKRKGATKRTKGHRQQLTKISNRRRQRRDCRGSRAAGPEGRAGSQGRAEGCRAQG